MPPINIEELLGGHQMLNPEKLHLIPQYETEELLKKKQNVEVDVYTSF